MVEHVTEDPEEGEEDPEEGGQDPKADEKAGEKDGAQTGEKDGEKRMTLGEHLEELRMRLFRSALAVTIAFCVCWAYKEPLGEWIRRPYNIAAERLNADLHEMAKEAITIAEAAETAEEVGEEEWREWYEAPGYPELTVLRDDLRVPERMKGDAASHGFFFVMKMCLYVSLFLAGPFVLWQMWQFIAAGLYIKERRVVYKYFPFSAGLFVGGVLFGYFAMVPNALYFLARMTLTEIQYFESVGNYWTFLVSLTLALGMVFQLPVVMLALAKLDIVTPATFAKYRAHMLVSSLLVAAVITPPDPFTQMLMAIPIAILYESGIWIGRLSVRGRAPVPEA